MASVTVDGKRGVLENGQVKVTCEAGRLAVRWSTRPRAELSPAMVSLTSGGQVFTLGSAALPAQLASCRLRDRLGQTEGLRLTGKQAGQWEAQVTVRLLGDTPRLVLAGRVRNLSKLPLTLDRLCLLSPESRLRLGSKPAALSVYVDSGGQGGTHVARLGEKQSCRGIAAAQNLADDLGFVCAYLSFEHDLTVNLASADEQVAIEALSSDPVTLAPGETVDFDPLLISVQPDALAGLEAYADAVQAWVRPPIPKQLPMGWVSWYAYRLVMTEEIVQRNAEVIGRHFLKYGMNLIQPDHGWQYKDICGQWVVSEKFPHGLRWLRNWLVARGMQLGLWVAPSTVSEFSTVYTEHPDALIQGADGKPLVIGEKWFWPPHGKTFQIDPLAPAGEQFLREFAGQMKSYGVTYLKTDFIGDWRGAKRLRHGMQTLRDALGPNVILRPCSTALNTQLGIANEIGVARDIGNAASSWEHLGTESLEVASKWFMHGKFWLNNSDVLIVGDKGETLGEAIGRTTQLALAGGVVFTGDKMPELERQPERLALVSLCIPSCNQAARPIDLFRIGEPGRAYPRVWHLPVRCAWGEWDVVGLFNWSAKALEETLAFSDLGLPRRGQYLVYDFWTHTLVGRFSGEVQVTVPAGAARCLRIMRVPETPAVVSTGMHVTQGMVDLAGVKWEAATLTLSGQAIRAPGETGSVAIYLPPGLALAEGSAAQMTGPCCAQLPLAFKQAKVKWSVRFRQQKAGDTLPLNPVQSILQDPMKVWGEKNSG